MSQIPNTSASIGGAPFQIGAVLSHTFSIFTRAFGKFTILSLIPLLPILLIPILGLGAKTGETATIIVGAAVAGILTMIVGTIANATALYGAYQEMRGESFTIGASFRVGLARVLPVIGLALVVGIAVGLASMLLVVPGLILLCMWYVAVPACIIENLGVGASLSRSSSLTKGYRWQLFGLLILVVVVSFIGTFALQYLVAAAGSVVVATLILFVWQVVTTSFGAVLSAIIYHDLRVAKEGVDVSKMAKVFD